MKNTNGYRSSSTVMQIWGIICLCNQLAILIDKDQKLTRKTDKTIVYGGVPCGDRGTSEWVPCFRCHATGG